MGKLVIDVVDPLGRRITCSRGTWYGHIVPGHNMMRGNLRAVKETLTDVEIIKPSSQISTTEVYFKKVTSATYASDSNLSVTKVAVHFSDPNNGEVRTAFPQLDYEGGVDSARQIYPKN